jgi:hypothetical protein
MARCAGCGSRTSGYTGYCRSCKSAIARGAKRAEAEGILVDFAGGAAWAWDRRGEVVAGPAMNKAPIWMALAKGIAPKEGTEA